MDARLDHRRYTPELVEEMLAEAGEVLRRLCVPGCWPAGYRSCMPEVIRGEHESYGWDAAEAVREGTLPPEVSMMDRRHRWLLLIPAEQKVLRRVVGLRSLARPGATTCRRTGRVKPWRPVLGWRAIGEKLRADHVAVQRWHDQALAIIADALNRPGLCAAAGGPVGPGRRAAEGAVARATRSALAGFAPAPAPRRAARCAPGVNKVVVPA